VGGTHFVADGDGHLQPLQRNGQRQARDAAANHNDWQWRRRCWRLRCHHRVNCKFLIHFTALAIESRWDSGQQGN
jgi:hypothetical protein